MRPHDKRGIPIYPGDLLKSPHYRDRRTRAMRYLYHVAVNRAAKGEPEDLHMVPTSELEPTLVGRGGVCRIRQELADRIEIIRGHGPGDCLCFRDRPRIKKEPTDA